MTKKGLILFLLLIMFSGYTTYQNQKEISRLKRNLDTVTYEKNKFQYLFRLCRIMLDK